ncbi:CubicO group peptidase, beta-lactamase class C family [Melghirimyces thermohalophilus]|uniref:CubicO group peptidase, beta-lactamase class C family n=1 Tax=Melghirimyces thermohalophilus TaxID=1236220 RepID=A0A1G6MW18_9BACL|nr:serine hydrolase [Melghirimyces thermohalophilus]SDC59434.1 CubicO group peptidase, beta-lactamase class C family [Melghirimyces thermohalophilus]
MAVRSKAGRRLCSAALALTLLTPAVALGSEASPGPIMEPKATVKKKGNMKQGPMAYGAPFPWDQPGPMPPVLHRGAPASAGMKKAPLQAIDPMLKQSIQDGLTPGAVVLVARQGTIVKQEAYGYAARYQDDQGNQLEQPVSMKEDTIFDLASISKVFTTVAAMQLVERGELALEDPVAKYIPEFAQQGKDEVTVRQLMTHTSGFEPWIPLYTMGESRKDRLNLVFAHPLENEPGTTYAYSDLNMITLGALVERISGQRLDQYVKENITAPLGMKDTMYNPPDSLKHRIAATEYQPGVGRGLVWGSVHDENAWSLDGVAGHAGVFSTAKDLAIFAHTMLNEGSYGGVRILKPETVAWMEKNHNAAFPGEDHGLGWELNQEWYMDALSDIHTLGHTGYTGTSLVVNRDNRVITITLTNRVHPTRETVSINPIRRQVARLTADAIPVAIPGKDTAWFAGYGDELDRSLTATIPGQREEGRTLTFDTWYRTEAEPNTEPLDQGRVEVSADSVHWTVLGEPFIGHSEGWKEEKRTLPADARYIRFRYQTDDHANGRGWYVKDPILRDGKGRTLDLDWSSDGWERRDG